MTVNARRSTGTVRGTWPVLVLGAWLLAACGSGDARSLVVVTVQAPAVVGLTAVEVTVTPMSGAVTKRFPWSDASGGTLQAGVYLPSSATGDATVSATGFAGTTTIATSGMATARIAAGAASAPVTLVLQMLAGPPGGDGGGIDVSGVDGGAGDGAAPASDGAISPADDASAGTDVGSPVDAAAGIDGSGADAAVAQPPSLTRCMELMHTLATCNLTTGDGDWGVRSVEFSPDGNFLVSAGEDGRVKVWRVTGTALDPDGRIFTGFGSSYAAFSPSGAVLAVGTHNGDVILYDFVQSTQLAMLTGLTGGVTALGFSSDGTKIVATDDEMHLQAWDTTTHAPVRTVTLTKLSGNMAVAPGSSGLWVAVQEGENAPLELIDLGNPNANAAPSVPMTGTISGLAFSPDGNTLAVGTDAGLLSLVDVSNRSQPKLLTPPFFTAGDQDVTALAYSRDGQYLLATTGQFRGPTAARIFNVATHAPRGTQATTYFPWAAAFSPDGRAVAVGQRDCGVILYCKD